MARLVECVVLPSLFLFLTLAVPLHACVYPFSTWDAWKEMCCRGCVLHSWTSGLKNKKTKNSVQNVDVTLLASFSVSWLNGKIRH